MSSFKEIGGYFELELKDGGFLHDDLVQLNSGRNAFEYVLRLHRPKKVYFPKYTCDVMLEPLVKLNIDYEFYTIDENLEIVNKPKLNKNEIILYTNYFGVKDSYSRKLARLYKDSFVLDCSQAYYFKPLKKGYTLYSPRKFFGVSDGGLLSTPKLLKQKFETDISSSRIAHLTERLELGAEAGYKDFKTNDESLVNNPIRFMSLLTKRILGNTDFDFVKRKRYENAIVLHKKFGSTNKLKIDPKKNASLMVYPLLVDNEKARQHLIDNKVFTALYWPNVLDWCSKDEQEYYLAQNILPLPIDQRYSIKDMEYIIKTLEKVKL